jgi:hypothetical protein
MTGQGIGDDVAWDKKKKASVTWVVRDRRGRRVLGTAASLHAAMKHAVKRGERYPILEQLCGPHDDSPGPVMWRRTL